MNRFESFPNSQLENDSDSGENVETVVELLKTEADDIVKEYLKDAKDYDEEYGETPADHQMQMSDRAAAQGYSVSAARERVGAQIEQLGVSPEEVDSVIHQALERLSQENT